MILSRHELKGVVASRNEIVGKVVIQTKEISPTTQEKTITPTKEQQIVVPDEGYTGLSKVTVDGVLLQNKDVTPSLEEQTIIADENYLGLNEVKVNAISSEYVKPSGTLDITTNGTYDVKNYESANVNVGNNPKKGIIVNSLDADGYIADVEIVGLTEIPNYYLQGSSSTSQKNVFSKIQKIKLPNDITKIGRSALSYQRSLTDLNLPDSITEFGNNCIYYDTSLNVQSLPANLQKIGEYCISNTITTELIVPSGVTEIPNNAMRNNEQLKKLVLNGNVTSIGTMAFYYCWVMDSFVMPNVTSVPELINSDAFTNTNIFRKKGYIYVPDNLIEDFKTATNWSVYADQIKGVSELV